MSPKIIETYFQKNKYDELSDNDKELYCMIEQTLLDYLNDEITFQQTILEIIDQTKQI